MRLTSGLFALVLSAVLCGTGCSVRRFAIQKVGDALSGGGTTFASDNDPELVRAAVPFSLKLMESLLAETPEHVGLLTAAASGFAQFGYAFVQQDADEWEDKDIERAIEMRARARRLYLRARDYGLRGLETRHKGFLNSLKAEPRSAVQSLNRKDLPLMYWTAVSWGAAVSVAKNDPDLIADLPQVESLIDRTLDLDETYDYGAIHTFLISYEMSRQGAQGDPASRARKHFDRAVELTGGQAAGPYVAFAESVSVQKQNRKEFDSLLASAVAVDPNQRLEWRLANLVAQRRAKWLQGRVDQLFLLPDDSTK